MNKRCANRLSSSEIENRANASKISNVIETRSRNRRVLFNTGSALIQAANHEEGMVAAAAAWLRSIPSTDRYFRLARCK